MPSTGVEKGEDSVSLVVTVVAGLVAPISFRWWGLMFGNLLRESGVVDRLSKTAQTNWPT